jgi:hypothetical protein
VAIRAKEQKFLVPLFSKSGCLLLPKKAMPTGLGWKCRDLCHIAVNPNP